MIDRTVFSRRRSSSRTVAINAFGGGVNQSTDCALLPARYARESWNFQLDSDALIGGEGVRVFALPSESGIPIVFPSDKKAKKAYFYRRFDSVNKLQDNRILIYCDDGKMYGAPIRGGEEFTEIPDVSFSSAPVGINYRYGGEDVFLLCSRENKLVVYAGEGAPTTIVDSPYVTSMAIHGERLFVTCEDDPTTLRFSDDFDPTNWYVALDEAGYVDFPDSRGKLLSVHSFLGYLYVFREYGITRLSAEGAQSGFSASQLFVSSGKIFGDTVTVCGDRIIFLASDGLYEFDGIYTKKVLWGIAPMISESNEDAVGAYARGRYYLSCNLTCDGQTVRAVLSYAPQSGSFYLIRGVEASHLLVVRGDVKEELVVVLSDGRLAFRREDAYSLDGVLTKTWRSGETDFGIVDERKRLSELTFYTDDDVTVCVQSDRQTRTYFVKGGAGLQRLRPNVTGSTFCLSFTSTTPKARIVRPVMRFSVG